MLLRSFMSKRSAQALLRNTKHCKSNNINALLRRQLQQSNATSMISELVPSSQQLINFPSIRHFSRIRSTTENKDQLDEEIKRMVEEDEREFLPGKGRSRLDETKKVDFEMQSDEEEGVMKHGANVARKEEDIRQMRKNVKIRNDIDTYDEGEVDYYNHQDEKLPLGVRERRQTVEVYDLFREKAQWGEFYRVFGMVLFLLGGYWLTIPFYNVVCQALGQSMSQHAKDYNFKEEEINVFRKFKISFMCHTHDEIPWEFQPSTPTVFVNAGETALSFYKVFNRADRPIAGIAIYQVYPEEVSMYFNKIQCFCFENQLLYPNESLELPLLFYMDPAICHDFTCNEIEEIFLTYHFFPSADQTIAEVLQHEIEKHQKEEQELALKKKSLLAKGVDGIDNTKNHGVIAQGYNPKDKPEMYIKKVLNSQKRIQYTIDQYVKENKLGEDVKIVHKMDFDEVYKKNMAMEESDSENADLINNRIVVAGS